MLSALRKLRCLATKKRPGIPMEEVLARIATELGLTADFLRHASKIRGAVAVDAHMRRRKTAKPSDWRRLEAQLNVYRLHARRIFEESPCARNNACQPSTRQRLTPAVQLACSVCNGACRRARYAVSFSGSKPQAAS